MRKRVAKIGLLIVMVVCIVMMMTACDLIDKLMGTDTVTNPPKVTSIQLLKDYKNYLDSKEYLYNAERGNVMALTLNESFILEIKYNNPKGYAITNVKINGKSVMASSFEKGSNSTVTRIKYTPTTEDERFSEDHSYRIDAIFYNTGDTTKGIVIEKDIETMYSVVSNASFKIELDHQNMDRRKGSTVTRNTITNAQTAKMGSKMKTHSVFSADHEQVTGLPAKLGGWVFDGYYTEKNGEGILVEEDDTYFFWEDITLYANYKRIFDYEIVNLDEEITHTYLDNGVEKEITFSKGAVITPLNEDDKTMYPLMNIDNTILDEKINANGSVSAVEYPVVEIGKEAFLDNNAITEVSISKYVTEIGYSAFENTNKVTQFTFNSGSQLKTIGDYAFADTKSLGKASGNAFTLPNTVSYLGNFAFMNSGWSSTRNSSNAESTLHIKESYKFIGVGCFQNTGFRSVVFDAGCYFNSQIDEEEAVAITKNRGWEEPKLNENRIGARIFNGCVNLNIVEFKTGTKKVIVDNKEVEVVVPTINILPDRAFDAFNNGAEGLTDVKFAEGLKFIGSMAFYYQEKIQSLIIPASVEEIEQNAFYNNEMVETLTFSEGSKLQILHSKAFGNLRLINRIELTTSELQYYGNGPFSGCSRLKSIEFPNLTSANTIPKGFNTEDTPQFADELIKGVGQTQAYADFVNGTMTVGQLGADESTTYSTPVRIFCNATVMDDLKKNFRDGKAYKDKDGNVSFGTGEFERTIFVLDINLVMTYINPAEIDESKKEVTIALQEIYSWNGGNVVGYSLAFWADRSMNVKVPAEINGKQIIEIGMYAFPNSINTITIPSSVKKIEAYAFQGCTRLSEVNYDNIDNLEYVGNMAFMNTNISEFVAGTSLKVIGQYAFASCGNLLSVDLSKSQIKNVAGVDENKKDGKEPIADGNRKIAKQTYKYSYEKTEDEGKRYDWSNVLGRHSFTNCSILQWVRLPKDIEQICLGTFTGCNSLKTIIIDVQADLLKKTGGTLNDEAFYERGLYEAVMGELSKLVNLEIYITTGTTEKHNILVNGLKYIEMGIATEIPERPTL